jgi:hypothetical protein
MFESHTNRNLGYKKCPACKSYIEADCASDFSAEETENLEDLGFFRYLYYFYI